MERRIKAVAADFRGGDSETVTRCGDYLYWAFRVTPIYASQQDARMGGFRNLIAASGIEPDGIPRAVALALALYSGRDVSEAVQAVAMLGADAVLGAMALPPEHREASIRGE